MDYSSNPSKTLKSLAKERGLGIDSMIESNDLILLGVVSCIISAIICVLSALVMRSLRDRDVDELYNRLESMEMAQRGAIGNDKRREKAEMMQMAALEAVQIIKDDKITDKKAALLAVALKYPQLSLDLASKALKQ